MRANLARIFDKGLDKPFNAFTAIQSLNCRFFEGDFNLEQDSRLINYQQVDFSNGFRPIALEITIGYSRNYSCKIIIRLIIIVWIATAKLKSPGIIRDDWPVSVEESFRSGS